MSMVTTGIHCEWLLECPLQELPSGMVMSDVSMDELRRRGQAALRTQIELGVRAEEAGYDYVIYPERHFELFFPTSPDPVLAQMAVAGQSDDIRLLQVANSLTRHDPVRLAERTAALDAVSEGRVDVGIMGDTDQLADPLFESTGDPDTAFVEYAELLAAA
jgi:Coenzyme F420-dependent N5,N10-methylene tetrahydromethanopterin reductase and related flavin-dependent oxidoreductases